MVGPLGTVPKEEGRRVKEESPLGIWQAGMLVGIHSLRREPSLGIKRLLLPVSYWRAAEFAFVFKALTGGAGTQVLPPAFAIHTVSAAHASCTDRCFMRESLRESTCV